MLRYLSVLLASFLSLIGVAHAAVPEAVTSALATASTDGATISGAVLGVIVVIMALKYARRAL